MAKIVLKKDVIEYFKNDLLTNNNSKIKFYLNEIFTKSDTKNTKYDCIDYIKQTTNCDELTAREVLEWFHDYYCSSDYKNDLYKIEHPHMFEVKEKLGKNKKKKEYHSVEEVKALHAKFECRNNSNVATKSTRLQSVTSASSKINIPTCPICGSADIQRISGGKRWLSTSILGLASSDIGKTMKCNNCKYKF